MSIGHVWWHSDQTSSSRESGWTKQAEGLSPLPGGTPPPAGPYSSSEDHSCLPGAWVGPYVPSAEHALPRGQGGPSLGTLGGPTEAPGSSPAWYSGNDPSRDEGAQRGGAFHSFLQVRERGVLNHALPLTPVTLPVHPPFCPQTACPRARPGRNGSLSPDIFHPALQTPGTLLLS